MKKRLQINRFKIQLLIFEYSRMELKVERYSPPNVGYIRVKRNIIMLKCCHTSMSYACSTSLSHTLPKFASIHDAMCRLYVVVCLCATVCTCLHVPTKWKYLKRIVFLCSSTWIAQLLTTVDIVCWIYFSITICPIAIILTQPQKCWDRSKEITNIYQPTLAGICLKTAFKAFGIILQHNNCYYAVSFVQASQHLEHVLVNARIIYVSCYARFYPICNWFVLLFD